MFHEFHPIGGVAAGVFDDLPMRDTPTLEIVESGEGDVNNSRLGNAGVSV
jgi:hypothetical protein